MRGRRDTQNTHDSALHGVCTQTRQALVTSTLHLVNREYAALADDFVNLGLLPAGADKSKVAPALTGALALC